jgi:hypothetical protein
MISKEITKHLSTVVDIQSHKFIETLKYCEANRPMADQPLSAEYLYLLEKVIWSAAFIEPVTRAAFASFKDYGQDFNADGTFDRAFREMPKGFKFLVEWDAVGRLTEEPDLKYCDVFMTNFRIYAISEGTVLRKDLAQTIESVNE